MPPWIIDSLARCPGMLGILHDGTMIGNDRNTDRNFLKNLLDIVLPRLLLLFAGCKATGMWRVGDPAMVVSGGRSLDIGGGGGGRDGGAWTAAIGV